LNFLGFCECLCASFYRGRSEEESKEEGETSSDSELDWRGGSDVESKEEPESSSDCEMD